MNKIYIIKCFDDLDERTDKFEIEFIYNNYEDAKRCIENNTFDFQDGAYLYCQLKSYVIGDYLPEYNINEYKDVVNEIYKFNSEQRKWIFYKKENN